MKTDEELIAEAEMSPCMGVCVADDVSGWCYGCGRTEIEIESWQQIDATTREEIQVELKGRVSELLEKRKAERAAGGAKRRTRRIKSDC